MVQSARGRSCCCSGVALAGLLTACVPALAQTAPLASSATVPSTTTPSTTASLQLALPDENHIRGVIFGDVIGRTIGDFKRLPSRDTLTWLGVGAAIALAAHPADRSTSASLAGSQALDNTLEAGETIGGAIFQFAGSTATYLAGRATGSGTVTSVGADLLRAQIVAQTMTTALKFAVRRYRPDGTQYSFPSGHSSVTFASATVLQHHYGWKAGGLAYGVATYVAASRIQEERHFLSDVAFGAAVGIAAGRIVTIDVGDNRFAVAPAVTRGGGGVSFSLVTD